MTSEQKSFFEKIMAFLNIESFHKITVDQYGLNCALPFKLQDLISYLKLEDQFEFVISSNPLDPQTPFITRAICSADEDFAYVNFRDYSEQGFKNYLIESAIKREYTLLSIRNFIESIIPKYRTNAFSQPKCRIYFEADTQTLSSQDKYLFHQFLNYFDLKNDFLVVEMQGQCPLIRAGFANPPAEIWEKLNAHENRVGFVAFYLLFHKERVKKVWQRVKANYFPLKHFASRLSNAKLAAYHAFLNKTFSFEEALNYQLSDLIKLANAYRDTIFTPPIDYAYEIIQDQVNIGLAEKKGKRAEQQDYLKVTTHALLNIKQLNPTARHSLYQKTISELQKNYGQRSVVGSTLCTTVCWVENQILHVDVANVGDSAAYVVIINLQNIDASYILRINALHNATVFKNENELKRVTQIAKSKKLPLPKNGRIDGLAVTRALGDLAYEKYGLLHTPDIYHLRHQLCDQLQVFVMVACDGLEERMSLNEILEVIKHNYTNDMTTLANALVKSGLDYGSSDNISVAIAKANTKPVGLTILDGHADSLVAREAGEVIYDVMEKHLNDLLPAENHEASQEEIVESEMTLIALENLQNYPYDFIQLLVKFIQAPGLKPDYQKSLIDLYVKYGALHSLTEYHEEKIWEYFIAIKDRRIYDLFINKIPYNIGKFLKFLDCWFQQLNDEDDIIHLYKNFKKDTAKTILKQFRFEVRELAELRLLTLMSDLHVFKDDQKVQKFLEVRRPNFVKRLLSKEKSSYRTFQLFKARRFFVANYEFIDRRRALERKIGKKLDGTIVSLDRFKLYRKRM